MKKIVLEGTLRVLQRVVPQFLDEEGAEDRQQKEGGGEEFDWAGIHGRPTLLFRASSA